jgi:anti-sigma B factor antagonist
MSELKLHVETTAAGVRVFRLLGPLTLNTLFEFQDMARANADLPVAIDLSGVPYMDSAGLGAILGVMASCQRKGRGFGIVGVTDRIQTLFRVTHVDGLIPTYASVETAERILSASAPAQSGSSSA